MSALLTVGCGGKEAPPPREPILLNISVTADEDINPSPRGRPSPVVVRVFELTDSGLFVESDYMELDENPKAVLEDTLLSAGDKVMVQPGKTVTIEGEAHPETKVVGLTAGYRDIDRAVWQVWREVPAPPEAGWFSSPVNVRLDIRLRELKMEIPPAKRKQPQGVAKPARAQGAPTLIIMRAPDSGASMPPAGEEPIVPGGLTADTDSVVLRMGEDGSL